jgi:hypothetical protein
MSLDANERTLRQATRTNGMPDADFEAFAGMDTEHIYIGDEFAERTDEPKTVTKCEHIKNRVHGTTTELTFYEEGFLKIREGNTKKLNKEHVLELRFIKPDPVTTRRIATSCLWSSLGSGILALLVSFVLPLTSLAQHTISATAVLATMTILSLLFSVYRSEVTHQFCTTSGQTVVLSLISSFGCERGMRTMAREIQQAIVRASADTGAHDVHYLRAEMSAHYKLSETGVISREACSDGTALILSKFG